jgi:alpha,alpha-trehalose-phosphate synthase [UDP-forming]
LSVGTGNRLRIVRVGVLTIRRACCNVSRVPTSASRLLVVSNRAPVEATPGGEEYGFRRTVGGLATALDVTLRERPGLWVAWAGTAGDTVLTPDQTALPYPIHTVHLSEREVDNYYGGFANQVLWPLCHIFPTRCVFEPAYWAAYKRVNERFASAVRRLAMPGDTVWVNDFHLCLVPGYLRATAAPVKLGLFWHIPFPPPEVFGICKWREELLQGLLGSDVVGLQTGDDARNFADCVRRFLHLTVEGDPPIVKLADRDVRVVGHGIGVDAEAFAAQARDPAVQQRAERLRQRLGAELVLIGVDRLDYTKGIVERLLGFERFLERQPRWRRKVSFVQITVPSRFRVPQYRELKRQIDETVGRIVGRFTREARAPLAYHYTGFDHEQLAAWYRAADVALVTPLRDGMNLVAKEYVACHPEGDGVLVLSEFAGAAHELTEAVLVNPYEPETICRHLEQAVLMEPEERRERMHALFRKVVTHDIRWWTRRFLEMIEEAAATGDHSALHPSVQSVS